MRPLNLLAAVLVATAAGVTDARAFSLSSVSSLLSRVGVNVTLPEVTIDLSDRAEAAIDRALTRAESVLDDLLDGREIDVDQVVSDALDRAQARIDAARERTQERIDAARERAQERIDAALARARSVLDRLDIELPEIDLPGIDLDDIDLDEIVEDASDEGILDDLLDDEPAVSSNASDLSSVSSFMIYSVGSSASFASLPVSAVEPAALGVPEPMTLTLIAPLLAGLLGRPRR